MRRRLEFSAWQPAGGRCWRCKRRGIDSRVNDVEQQYRCRHCMYQWSCSYQAAPIGATVLSWIKNLNPNDAQISNANFQGKDYDSHLHAITEVIAKADDGRQAPWWRRGSEWLSAKMRSLWRRVSK